jgi:hypothetical protein
VVSKTSLAFDEELVESVRRCGSFHFVKRRQSGTGPLVPVADFPVPVVSQAGQNPPT